MEKKIAIIGMGALWLLFGDILQSAYDVGFIVDKDRQAIYGQQAVKINGMEKSFPLLSAGSGAPVDLLLFAVKGPALLQAMEDASTYIGPDTILLSLLNGISSEEIIAKRFGAEHVVFCIAEGMDAVRTERSLTYTKKGKLCIGLPGGKTSKDLETVAAIFQKAGVPYSLDEDILHRLWGKFMLNVGVNQVVMVREGTYGTVQKDPEARGEMLMAMREVIALSKLEGICVTEEDLRYYVGLVDTLSPDGMPSMRQDGLAKRKSEVELFAGTVCRLARKHHLAVPVNEALYKAIQDKEASYLAP